MIVPRYHPSPAYSAIGIQKNEKEKQSNPTHLRSRAPADSACRGLPESGKCRVVWASGTGTRAPLRLAVSWGPDQGEAACLHRIPDQTAGEIVTPFIFHCCLKNKFDYLHNEEISHFLFCSLLLSILSTFLLDLLPSLPSLCSFTLPPSVFLSFFLPTSICRRKCNKVINSLFSEPEGFFWFVFWPKIYLQLKQLVK